MLTLIEGPAGGGKSEIAAELLESGAVDVLSDITALWVALAGVVRGPDGRYPERQDDDPALAVALYLQAVAVRFALAQGHNVAVTTSRAGQVERWQEVAEDAGAAFSVRTVDPGRSVIVARLTAADGILSEACRRAIERWYIE